MELRMEGMNDYAVYGINGSAIVNAPTKGDTVTVPTADLPAGLYILKVTGIHGTESVKFMKR